jgi:two-component system, cell cycle sensor histidine kinase and response regulator CckA
VKTILIVDDRADNRNVLIAMLHHRGYRLLEAESGAQALPIVTQEKPDLVITDVLMPKMDGYEFVRQLRNDPAIAQTRVIFYTASYIEAESRRLAEACGVRHLIIKPAEPEEVFAQVDAALGESKPKPASVPSMEFDREHLHLVSDKLAEKVEELEKLNATLEREITERKAVEKRLREHADIINRAHEAIIIRGFNDQRILFWNRGAERIYGWRTDEAVGRLISELMFVDPTEQNGPLRTLIETGEFHGELRHRAKDGREVIVDARVTLIRNDDGTPHSILGISADTTEHKKLEMQLLRTQRLESIGTLASGVAHDLNNVLGPILMAAESLQGNATGAHAAGMVSLIEESARRGSSIVKQVLTFARGVEGERVLINPRHLIDEMVEIAKKTFPKSIEITGQYPEHPWSISGDPTQLHQVLLNLSMNARDTMANGGSLILAAENMEVDENYAAMTPGAKPGPHVILRVSDTGAGIPRAMIDKIFEPFFTTKDLGKGTGLGLSTSLGIVKSHAGFISVSSEQGSGATFEVYLPAVQADVAPFQKEIPVDLIKGNGELVLLVDDEINVRQVTKITLEKHNYRVMEANDGPEALAIFAQHMDSVDVVLTDMMMPYLDGIAVIRALKKMKPDMIFIASTGQGDEARLAELQELGVVNFLSKPYDTRKLLTVLESAV